jgi:hypothetical protein
MNFTIRIVDCEIGWLRSVSCMVSVGVTECGWMKLTSSCGKIKNE